MHKHQTAWLTILVATVSLFGCVILYAGTAHATTRIGHPVSVTERSIQVGPHGVVIHSTLRHCRNEDGSGSHLPCTWNIGSPIDGNGRGLSYWIGVHHHTHYVWPVNPIKINVGPPLMWVTRELADAIVEGQVPDEPWLRCVTNGFTRHGHLTVACPDGYVLRQN